MEGKIIRFLYSRFCLIKLFPDHGPKKNFGMKNVESTKNVVKKKKFTKKFLVQNILVKKRF